MDDLANTDWGYTPQDDYDTWMGEANLVRNGSGPYAVQGWIAYNRHSGGSSYIFYDDYVKWMHWSQARTLQYPDHMARYPPRQSAVLRRRTDSQYKKASPQPSPCSRREADGDAFLI